MRFYTFNHYNSRFPCDYCMFYLSSTTMFWGIHGHVRMHSWACTGKDSYSNGSSRRRLNLLKNWYNSIEPIYCGKYESLELGFRIFRVTATHNEQYENKFGCLFISNILQYRTFIFKILQTLCSILQAESKVSSSIAVFKMFQHKFILIYLYDQNFGIINYAMYMECYLL